MEDPKTLKSLAPNQAPAPEHVALRCTEVAPMHLHRLIVPPHWQAGHASNHAVARSAAHPAHAAHAEGSGDPSPGPAAPPVRPPSCA